MTRLRLTSVTREGGGRGWQALFGPLPPPHRVQNSSHEPVGKVGPAEPGRQKIARELASEQASLPAGELLRLGRRGGVAVESEANPKSGGAWLNPLWLRPMTQVSPSNIKFLSIIVLHSLEAAETTIIKRLSTISVSRLDPDHQRFMLVSSPVEARPRPGVFLGFARAAYFPRRASGSIG